MKDDAVNVGIYSDNEFYKFQLSPPVEEPMLLKKPVLHNLAVHSKLRATTNFDKISLYKCVKDLFCEWKRE